MYSLIEKLSQELASQFSVDAAANSTASAITNSTTLADAGGLGPLSDFALVWKLLASFGLARDWIKLFLLGSVLETIRRFATTIWSNVVNSFFLTASFESDDDAYNWMMVWIARQPTWSSARDVQVSTKGWGIDITDYSSRGIYLPGQTNDSSEKRPLHFLPSFDLTQTFWYQGHRMRFTRSRRALRDGDDVEILTIRILTRSQRVLNKLLIEAKTLYEKEEQHRVSIYTASPYNDWRRSGSRPKRPMESIVLDQGLKDMVLQDAQEFIGSERWYSERGLPYRRGYLFYGCPGSGKTSLVHAIAGELNLDIYVLNLSRRGLDDNGLSELVADLPARSIALIEEIDAAFLHGVNRDASQPEGSGSQPATTGVTLSGLLASIDGIQASEGRLLFATTNKYHALDSALIRAGRLDVHVEFTYASKDQAEELFKRFYHSYDTPSTETKPAVPRPATSTKKSSYVPPKPEKLAPAELNALAKEFAGTIPDGEFAMASIQGLLLNFKNRPSQVIKEVPAWVGKERKARRERELAMKASEEKKKTEEDTETLTVPAVVNQQAATPPPEQNDSESDRGVSGDES
ncbi:P-loop containing nucleoside triphosphate hydrolase protein [Serendipita vermifera]|nr:P-loop containing nucleoside triphosphate hydrolase protein [Serendipita vermifera]